MKASIRWIVCFSVVLMALPATAGKIGFLDAERAVSTVQEGKKQLQALQDWATPRQERIEELRAKAVELNNQLNSQRSVASASVLADLEEQLLRAQRDFEDAGRTFNRNVEVKQNEFLSDVATKIGQVASEYAAANDFDAVFMLKAQPLAYVRESSDITDIVIRLYDEKYPVN
jgi:Skp family chaperone for outer membrane proteins